MQKNGDARVGEDEILGGHQASATEHGEVVALLEAELEARQSRKQPKLRFASVRCWGRKKYCYLYF